MSTIAEKNTHIPTEEILKDIADTEAEIIQMEREIEGLRLVGDRLSHYRADARVSGIRQRQDFIAKLNEIIAERRGGIEGGEKG